jgi:hypothetical protein
MKKKNKKNTAIGPESVDDKNDPTRRTTRRERFLPW